ncbi:hypothetical protein ACETRY_04575 [Cronobacter malonaticus]|uniref:DUF7740 domain-containing protein n=1 Tax=Cronobacter malonaticus TaxID=413503 RepID=UPI00386AE30D
MSLKHRIPEMIKRIDHDEFIRATDEYADLLITMCLCMRIVGPTRANVKACALALKQRLKTRHSQQKLGGILRSPDPVGQFLTLRREVNRENAKVGIPADQFL